eukprot:10907290-Karenia_brevis.AAC.1
MRADFNREPEQIEEQRFRLGPHSIMVPKGVKGTCHNGRLIDCYVVAPEVAHWGRDTKVIAAEGEQGLHLNWDGAQAYINEHKVTGDARPFVDRTQQEYIEGLGLGPDTSQRSTQATVMLASKGDSTLADITKRVGYGQRDLFKLQRAKAPHEMEMYQHKGIAC